MIMLTSHLTLVGKVVLTIAHVERLLNLTTSSPTPGSNVLRGHRIQSSYFLTN